MWIGVGQLRLSLGAFLSVDHAAAVSNLLLESGSNILLESGDLLLTE